MSTGQYPSPESEAPSDHVATGTINTVMRSGTSAAGDANVMRACMVAENVDVAAGHSKMLAVLVAGPREGLWWAPRYGLQWLKRSERHG
jgi:hypothetical protein